MPGEAGTGEGARRGWPRCPRGCLSSPEVRCALPSLPARGEKPSSPPAFRKRFPEAAGNPPRRRGLRRTRLLGTLCLPAACLMAAIEPGWARFSPDKPVRCAALPGCCCCFTLRFPRYTVCEGGCWGGKEPTVAVSRASRCAGAWRRVPGLLSPRRRGAFRSLSPGRPRTELRSGALRKPGPSPEGAEAVPRGVRGQGRLGAPRPVRRSARPAACELPEEKGGRRGIICSGNAEC